MSALAKAKKGGPPDLAIILGHGGHHDGAEEETDGEGGDHEDAKRDAVEALAEGLGIEPKDIDVDKVMEALGMLHELHASEEDDGDEEEEDED